MPSRFHPVTSEETINKMGTKRFAASTDSKIRWATNLFREWQSHRNEVAEEEPSKNLSYILVPLENMSVDELNYTISRFVCEVKKIDGTDYPSDALYGLVICLQLYMDSIGRTYKFLTDECFSQIKNTLDNAMKERAKNHVNSAKKQAEVITLEEEEVLWSSSVLGSDTPKQLVETLFYLIGINFALRGGQEHRNLRWGASSQLRLGQDQHGRYLSYTEDVSKTNQGGLKHRKCKVKSVRAYENREIPERCPVQLYERYSTFRPLLKNDSEPFYLRPLDNPRGEVWYSSQGIGRHTLAGIVSDVCIKRAGIPGYRTNHSLRASAATRLYDAGVDEQLICEVTGHRSSAVREYKRTNSAQKQKLSTIVQGHSRDLSSPAKKMALENISVTVNVDVNK